jgi:hypothetical protein
MSTVKLKIVGYEESSHSIIVSFASDETKSQNPADYPGMAWQPLAHWPNDDVDTILKRIAQVGVSMTKQQAEREKIQPDNEKVLALKSMVGQEISYDVNVLLNELNIINTNSMFTPTNVFDTSNNDIQQV